jgi:general L-amino acid transport system permease protein
MGRRARAIFIQLVLIASVVALGAHLVGNALDNLEQRGIAVGFGFLGNEAGFAISETPIDFSPTDTYARAFAVGLLNTLKVSGIGIVLATLMGVIIGIARLSSNWLVAKLAAVYVETLRNLPLLLQLFFWYGLFLALPAPGEAINPVAGVFLSSRGLWLPAVSWDPQEAGGGFGIDWPQLEGFNFTGGIELTPEFAALLIGLTTYTAAFIAEIVRAGIMAVPRGQIEAAEALGLRPGLVMRLVILPQGLRLMVPPCTSQYLNLAKNSSLAVAIGYPDLVSISNTSINQTGQAIEGVAIIMAVYLSISLAISAVMNWYNGRIALRGA